MRSLLAIHLVVRCCILVLTPVRLSCSHITGRVPWIRCQPFIWFSSPVMLLGRFVDYPALSFCRTVSGFASHRLFCTFKTTSHKKGNSNRPEKCLAQASVRHVPLVHPPNHITEGTRCWLTPSHCLSSPRHESFVGCFGWAPRHGDGCWRDGYA